MIDVKIDKGRPMPEKSGRGKYPWSELAIGDSFLVKSRQFAFGSLANYNKKMKARKQKQLKIQTRSEGDKCRVWRVS
jgi:hypothetical protein